MGKKKLLHFPTLASARRRQVGEIMTQRFIFIFFFLWMERNNRLRGTLMVLRNPIHMAPCTRETSDNQETACQEDNNSSPFNLITATGTYNSTQAGVHWAAGATNKNKNPLRKHGTAAPSWSVTCSIVALWGWCNSDARGKITPRKTTSVGIRKTTLGSGRVKQNKAGSWLPRRHVSGLRRGSSQSTEIMCSVKKPGVFWGLLVYFKLHNWKVPHADSLETLKKTYYKKGHFTQKSNIHIFPLFCRAFYLSRFLFCVL